MSSGLYESIARIARHEVAAQAVAAVGRVVDVFPAGGGDADHAVSVELRDLGLVLPRVPIAVGALGFAAIPALGEVVVVVFLHGDLNAPVVVGRLYHPDQDPPEHAPGQLVLRLPSGGSAPKLELEVEEDPPAVKLDLAGEKLLLELVEEKASLKVGELELSLDGAGGGRIEIAGGGSKVTIKKDGDVTIAAAGKLKLEATEVEISGSAKVKVSGAQVEIN